MADARAPCAALRRFRSLTLGAVAYGGKFVSTYLAVKPRVPKPIPLFAGLLFNYRLSFGIIAASFGYEKGLIDLPVYSAMLMVVLLTSTISAVLMKTHLQKL